MATVSIGGNDFTTYATVADADTYLSADPFYATAWAGYDADFKARCLVGSYRQIEKIPDEQWKDGTRPDATTQALIDASIVMAAEIGARPRSAHQRGTTSNIKATGAGSARVEFFAPEVGGVFSDSVMALLNPLLGRKRYVGKAGGSSATVLNTNYSRGEGLA